MKSHPSNNRFNLKPLALGIALVSVLGVAQAKSLTETNLIMAKMHRQM